VDSAGFARAGAAFEALWLETLLQPVMPGSDALSSYGMSAVAQSIAEHDPCGFGSIIAERMNGHVR